jgi:hypothetical protein
MRDALDITAVAVGIDERDHGDHGHYDQRNQYPRGDCDDPDYSHELPPELTRQNPW